MLARPFEEGLSVHSYTESECYCSCQVTGHIIQYTKIGRDEQEVTWMAHNLASHAREQRKEEPCEEHKPKFLTVWQPNTHLLCGLNDNYLF